MAKFMGTIYAQLITQLSSLYREGLYRMYIELSSLLCSADSDNNDLQEMLEQFYLYH